jgi:Response regulator containing a CheY-like receiver domain and an HTH DNA-binding domain
MIKILLADDHSIIREALRIIIENNIPGSVVEETMDADSVLKKAHENEYDLLMLDINMPGINSVELIAKILSVKAGSRILIFSMNPAVPFEKIYLGLGAKGYLSKTSSHDEIIKAIDTVMAGNIYRSCTKETGVAASAFSNPFESLSPREMEILQYILHGKAVKEIYSQSGLAASTISTYKARIHNKLGTKNIIDLMSLAKTYNIIKD